MHRVPGEERHAGWCTQGGSTGWYQDGYDEAGHDQDEAGHDQDEAGHDQSLGQGRGVRTSLRIPDLGPVSGYPI